MRARSSPGTACRNSSWTATGREVERPFTYSSCVSSPSVEDKIVKFPEAKRHQVLLEPEANLVPRRLRTLDDLVLDRRAIARAPPTDRSTVQRRLLEMSLDDLL